MGGYEIGWMDGWIEEKAFEMNHTRNLELSSISSLFRFPGLWQVVFPTMSSLPSYTSFYFVMLKKLSRTLDVCVYRKYKPNI